MDNKNKGITFTTPNYIKSLLLPSAKTPRGRRVWSIDLESAWLPFFTATNVMGDTAIPAEALGCPIRLAYSPDGSVKFSKTGRPITRVAKPISDSVTLIRGNFVANLMAYAEDVANKRKEAYADMVKASIEAGKPIVNHDKAELDKAVKAQVEQAMREAEAKREAVDTKQPDKELVAVA